MVTIVTDKGEQNIICIDIGIGIGIGIGIYVRAWPGCLSKERAGGMAYWHARPVGTNGLVPVSRVRAHPRALAVTAQWSTQIYTAAAPDPEWWFAAEPRALDVDCYSSVE